MALHIEPHAEPIAGYRLIERLGSGGFGEVWKAEAPGGLFKAIKFVQRGRSSDDDSCVLGADPKERSPADQEMRSLSRVKSVHHPYVISLERFEIVEDYLVIVMELADRTLFDRFKQCRHLGLPGVPRDELLGYLYEAAEALDLMNSQYQLQHLDIKPQNLFLVHNHIKVADFGLVKDISDKKFMTITGGVTPVYAAPETFDGKFSRQSDQYSLAIVYQEILTGHRPFTGTTMKQLILQHLQNGYDLSPAPVHDRPILARALAKNPEERFATCLDFIMALRRATAKNQAVVPTGEPAGEAPQAPAASERAFPSAGQTLGVRGEKAGPIKPVSPNFSVGRENLVAESGAAGTRENVPPARPIPANPSAPRSGGPPPSGSAPPSSRPRTPLSRPPAATPTGVVQPALVVGLGQLGIDTLSQVRQRIAADLGTSQGLPHVRLVAIDTDPGAVQKATTAAEGGALKMQEAFVARLQRASYYLKTKDGKLPTDSWLNPKLLYRIPREQTGAGLRPLARLAFIDNYRSLAMRLDAELRALGAHDTPVDSSPESDLGLRTARPRVYLVASLTGNTGSGMFVDVAYLLRNLLTEQGHDDVELVGMLYIPSVPRAGAPSVAVANAYAALTELQYYCRPDAMYSAQCETASSPGKAERITQSGPAIDRCILLPLPELNGPVRPETNATALAGAADFLFRDLVTRLGQTFDEERHAVLTRSGEEPPGLLVESIGMTRILWPRHSLLAEAGRRLCQQLVTRWMQKDATAVADTIRQWTHESWDSLGMRPENLIERFQDLSEHVLRQKPEQMLAEILAPAQPAADTTAKDPARAAINLTPLVKALDALERLMGIPEEVRTAKQVHAEPGLFERAFTEIAHDIADECEQKLAELAVTLLEDPNYRLAGAEESLRQFCGVVEQALKSQEILAKELTEKAGQFYLRLQHWIERPIPTHAPTATQWSFGLARRGPANPDGPTATDLFELLRTYAKTRYHSIVLAHLNHLYVALRGHLSDQIREVGFCRQRLGELQGLLAANEKLAEPKKGEDRVLLPPGCRDRNAAVEEMLAAVTIDDLIQFDDRVQHWIKTNCEALLQICMGTATMVRNLAPAMIQESERFLGERLHGASISEMYLAAMRAEHGDSAEDLIVDDLQRCLEDATPELGRVSTDREVSIIALPNNAAGLELKRMVARRLPRVKIVLTERLDEIIFFHELVAIPWRDLEQLGVTARKTYEQRSAADPASLHTREDVFDVNAILASAN